MNKLYILIIAILIAGCKKEPVKEDHCAQCRMVVTDSATGDTLEINYGNPTKSMYRCNEALDYVLYKQNIPDQHFDKFNTAQYGYSKTQKYKEYCN